MTTSKKNKPPAPPNAANPKALQVIQTPGETTADAVAHTALWPTVQAAMTVMDYNKGFGELSVNTLVADLGKQVEQANSGDLSRAEALLTAQAHTLDAIFNNLARRAAMNLGEYLNAAETYLRLALKAQSQCRATLETLAEIKNPQPTAFIKQQNIAANQQINNGAPDSTTSTRAHAPARAEQSANQPNKLLEHQHGERLDFGTAGTASGADSTLEAMGTVHRSEDTGR